LRGIESANTGLRKIRVLFKAVLCEYGICTALREKSGVTAGLAFGVTR
jgi:hypothetical protein